MYVCTRGVSVVQRRYKGRKKFYKICERKRHTQRQVHRSAYCHVLPRRGAGDSSPLLLSSRESTVSPEFLSPRFIDRRGRSLSFIRIIRDERSATVAYSRTWIDNNVDTAVETFLDASFAPPPSLSLLLRATNVVSRNKNIIDNRRRDG